MASSVSKLRYHIVWATKYRYALLDEFVSARLAEYLPRKQEKWGFQILSCAIEPDHVHLLIEVEPHVDLPRLIGKLKGGSSFFLRRRCRKLMVYSSLWTPSHFCGTVGSVSEKTVRDYLASQGHEEEEVVQRTFVYEALYSQRKFRTLKRYLKGVHKKDKTRAPAAMIQNACRVKSKVEIPLRNDLIKLEKRDTKESTYWLRLPGGKLCETEPFWIGLKGREIPSDARICDSAIRIENGGVEVHLVIEQRRIIQRAKIDRVVAVDLGVRHPITSVTLVDGRVRAVDFQGKSVKKHSYQREQHQAKLQSKGVENIDSHLETYNNRVRDDVHQITHQLVEHAKECDAAIVVGNIHGIVKRWKHGGRHKAFLKQARGVPYGRIMGQLWYKATLAGVPLCFVNEAYTSQTCHCCFHCEEANRQSSTFRCKNCNHEVQSDVNGAINIGTMALAHHLRCCDSSFGELQ